MDPTFLQSDSDDEQQKEPGTSSKPHPGLDEVSISNPEPEPSDSGRQSAGEPGADETQPGASDALIEGRPSHARTCKMDAEGPGKESRVAGVKHRLEDSEEEGRLHEQPEAEVRHPRRNQKKLHDLSDVSSVGITARGPLDEYRFNMFMRDLLAEKAKDIFRCKGVLSVHVSHFSLRDRSLTSACFGDAGQDADCQQLL